MKVTMKFAKLSVADYIEHFCFKEKFIKFCERCDYYGHNYSCPPFSYDTDKYLRKFDTIYLIGTKVDVNRTEADALTEIVDRFVYGRNIVRSTRKTLDGKLLRLEERYPLSRAFFAGSCVKCDECAKLYDEPCPDPGSVRTSLEAFGFDMVMTATELFDIEMLWSDDYLPEYFTLISGFATLEEIADFDNEFLTI